MSVNASKLFTTITGGYKIAIETAQSKFNSKETRIAWAAAHPEQVKAWAQLVNSLANSLVGLWAESEYNAEFGKALDKVAEAKFGGKLGGQPGRYYAIAAMKEMAASLNWLLTNYNLKDYDSQKQFDKIYANLISLKPKGLQGCGCDGLGIFPFPLTLVGYVVITAFLASAALAVVVVVNKSIEADIKKVETASNLTLATLKAKQQAYDKIDVAKAAAKQCLANKTCTIDQANAMISEAAKQANAEAASMDKTLEKGLDKISDLDGGGLFGGVGTVLKAAGLAAVVVGGFWAYKTFVPKKAKGE